MTVLAWLGHALSATAWLAFNLVVASGLFLLSAFVATQPDAASGALFVRGLATFWLYIAAWNWLVRGILARPAPPSERRKPTGAEVARSAVGCLANLVPIPFVFWFVGRLADRTWAGLTSPDPSDPAKLAASRLLSLAYYAIDHADAWLPYAIGGFVLLVFLSIINGSQRAKRRRGASAQEANAETLARLRSRSKGRQPRDEARMQDDRTAQASRVAAAPPPPRPGSGRRDAVLGQLSWSSAESAWWVQREDGFPVLIAGTPDGPDPAALTRAHQVVQRSFEVLLRASEAAHAEAQGRGVGLPRFTIAAAHVSGKEARLHLRCDADAKHDYVVRSTDGLLTFRAGA